MAIIEAMAMGKPVVATRAGGNPELIQDEETGLLIERNPQALASALHSILSDADRRRRMGDAAVKLALSAGYTNAGTIEFLVDFSEKAGQNFYFLEMNTRLQVEHPVTELVTGLDLVHLQIAVAEGRPLPLTQKDVQLRGHAIECRIYAEDPENNFFPSPGLITRLIQPGGPGLREDCAVYEGWRVPLDYDPMLSKLIAYAPTRELAIDRMLRALDEYVIGGIATNINFFRRILTDADFRAANIDTGYLDRLLAKPKPAAAETSAETTNIAAIAAALFEAANASAPAATPASTPESEWMISARKESRRA